MPWIEFDGKLLHAQSGIKFKKLNKYFSREGIFIIHFTANDDELEVFDAEELRDTRWQELKVLLGIAEGHSY